MTGADENNILGALKDHGYADNDIANYSKLVEEGQDELDKCRAPYLPAPEERRRPWDRLACFLKRKLTLSEMETEKLRVDVAELHSAIQKNHDDKIIDVLSPKVKNKVNKGEKIIKPHKKKPPGPGLQFVCPDCNLIFNQNDEFVVLTKCHHVLHKSCAERRFRQTFTCKQCGADADFETMVTLNFNRSWEISILKNQS